MKRTLFALIAVVGFATSASAGLVSITPDAASYNVSDTITLTVVADPEGAAGTSVFADLLFDIGLVTFQSSTTTTGTSFGGFVPWTPGVLQNVYEGDNTILVVDQIISLMPQGTDPGGVTATVVFHASAPGVANFTFDGNTLNVFGAPNVSSSVTIVPEPTTAALMGLGLMALGMAGRRR